EYDEVEPRERSRRGPPVEVGGRFDDVADDYRQLSEAEDHPPRRRPRSHGSGNHDPHTEVQDIERDTVLHDEGLARRPKYSDYDSRHRRVPQADLNEIKDRLEELGRQHDDRKRRQADAELAQVKDRLYALTEQLDERRSRMPEEIAQVKDRLDTLSEQLDERRTRMPEEIAQVKDRLETLAQRFDQQQRRVPDQELAEIKDRLDHLTAHLEERHQQVPDDELAEVKERLDAVVNQLDEHHRRFPEEDFAALNERLDMLAQQLDHLVHVNAHAQQPPASDSRDDLPTELADALTRLDQRLDQLILEGRSATSEIERRVTAVDRAVASLERDKFRPPTVASPTLAGPASPLDQALFEIAARQQALDGEWQPR